MNDQIIEIGKKLYGECVTAGTSPRSYVDLMMSGPVETISRRAVAKIAPDELSTFDDCRKDIVRAMGAAAREVGDNDTASYVTDLLSE